MPGIPADFDFSFLRGAELAQVCLGAWQVQLHFAPPTTITVSGDWDLTDTAGRVIDRSSDTVRERPFQLHLLLRRAVIGVEVAAPLSFALRFTGGLVLRVVVRTDGYESFPARPANIFV